MEHLVILFFAIINNTAMNILAIKPCTFLNFCCRILRVNLMSYMLLKNEEMILQVVQGLNSFQNVEEQLIKIENTNNHTMYTSLITSYNNSRKSCSVA